MGTSCSGLVRASAFVAILFIGSGIASAQKWQTLFNGKNLDGWEVRGDAIWTVMTDGTLLGQRRHPNAGNPFDSLWPITLKQYRSWIYRQAWLYTTRNFGQYNLHLEYWIPPGCNSGVSIRDTSRAHYVIGEPDAGHEALLTKLRGTPAHIGYEIQIIDPDNNHYSSGSVYLFAAAKQGVQRSGKWNSMDIESRVNEIRVKLNGELVAESPGDPQRSKTGPIGLQLHDRFTFAMFRNIRIREIKNGR